MTTPRYTFEVEAYHSDPRVLEEAKRSQRLMNNKVTEIARAFNESIERAALALLADGAPGLYQARSPDGAVSLCVGDMPAVGEYIDNVACTVTLEWDGPIANVATTWRSPYEHLNH